MERAWALAIECDGQIGSQKLSALERNLVLSIGGDVSKEGHLGDSLDQPGRRVVGVGNGPSGSSS